MSRAKRVRLVVRDLGDVLRWAQHEQARRLDSLRYRQLNGHDIVSFRLVPGYRIEIGARDIGVIAIVRGGWRDVVRRQLLGAGRRLAALARAGFGRPHYAIPTAPAEPVPPLRLPQ